MIYWHQLDGNNVEVEGYDSSGVFLKSPGYNAKMGFGDGAQTDIFSDKEVAGNGSDAGTSTMSGSRTGTPFGLGGVFMVSNHEAF
jgi:hypothetical protein